MVGIGPGAYEDMTLRAIRTLEQCECIVGYTVYVELVQAHFPEKKFLTTPMKQEVKRCEMAFEEAQKGVETAMICSGDAGVYGMSGLIWSMQERYPMVEVKVIPGVTAALSGGAILGAPLIHDFCVISLSDLLTPWKLIETRIACAAKGDFCICLYNPSSKKRKDYLKKACAILLKEREKDTACGYVSNIGRVGEHCVTCTLEALQEVEVDMFTTVFIGNTTTRIQGEHMITPRGYKDE